MFRQYGPMGQQPFTGAFPNSPYFTQAQPTQPYAPQQQQPPSQQNAGMLPLEMSFIENILRMNRGKHVRVYMTFEGNPEWPAEIFEGVIEAAGRDHIIISDTETGQRYLLLMVYLDYVVFDEPIDYEYPYVSNGQPLVSYSPR